MLTVAASSFGIVMGASPLLQIRKMLAKRSSREVSIGYFAILAFGSTLWGSYAVTIHNTAVLIPNVVAGITAVATIAVAVSLRRIKEVVLAGDACRRVKGRVEDGLECGRLDVRPYSQQRRSARGT